ncbi:DUF977 family protein [Escherichia coli]|uniref:DUF977 family protein n=1 Tax=Escherichia coli TaxID=562 RepID=UPI0002511137|nr:DUF977 family protein [Escherichia coli]EFG1010697.1 DUF977 family protein [Escherichia coli]EFG6207090.1 DUF977 family protein [Escherichia coli]EFH3430247.1 DUF977 family protein [Escherichia coli]EFI6182171.1 DUF977 family protein [Escherichia coli]EFK3437975.1 DUF977 family protein [Escherichia coli]
MAKAYTPEQRENLKARIIDLVRKNERMTMSQLERATGAGWHSVRRCLVDVLACGDLYMSGKYGVFASEQAYRTWRKKPEKADMALVRKLPDGEIRRYDRSQNIICRECRKSEAMQRVLAFYQGNYQEVMA